MTPRRKEVLTGLRGNTGLLDALTARQRSLLLHCYAGGYYEIPRRATLRAMAKGLGISATTLSLVLRRAEAKVVAAYALAQVVA
jgi:predicted DNA binding protein